MGNGPLVCFWVAPCCYAGCVDGGVAGLQKVLPDEEDHEPLHGLGEAVAPAALGKHSELLVVDVVDLDIDIWRQIF